MIQATTNAKKAKVFFFVKNPPFLFVEEASKSQKNIVSIFFSHLHSFYV